MTNDLLRTETVLQRLTTLHPKLIDLGLDRGLGLLDKLGSPHLDLPPVIHVAGTNGKGSSLAFMQAVFKAAGKTAHSYTSPHLVRFHERIRISGKLISSAELADLLEEVETINAGAPMTFFEITTAAAFLAFSRHPADVTLLETGLGGRADSTNVIPAPKATLITPIAKDHEHFLGDTLTAIAGEKAGIMRPDIPCFSCRQHPEVEAALIASADKLGVPLYLAERDFAAALTNSGIDVEMDNRRLNLTSFGLKGRHQHDNAGLAAACLMKCFPDITDRSLKNGIAKAEWPGRIQHLHHGILPRHCPSGVQLWLDGAHNAHGATALAATLGDISPAAWVLICGALNTRPPKDFLTPLMPLINQVITITIPDQEAALTAAELAAAAQALGIAATPANDLNEALELGGVAAKCQGGNIIIAGSLYLAGHVLELNQTPPQ
jgi:dihydrofolate synthase/folylpolyglutamate synthase